MSDEGTERRVPMRRCANHPKCHAIIRADVGTLHCEECHRTDPELIVAAAQYRVRVRNRAVLRTPTTGPR